MPPFQARVCYDLIVRIGQRDAMRTIELIGDIDGQHRLHARVPTEISAGQAPRVMVFLPEEDEAGRLWANGMASEWSADLADPREDIYSLDDNHRVNAGSKLGESCMTVRPLMR